MNVRRPLRRLLVACALLALSTACRSFSVDGLAANAEDKPATLALWSGWKIDGLPATAYLWRHTGLLLTGVDGFRPIEGSAPLRGEALLHGVRVDEFGGATACAIDERGFWLTAAHCVGEGPLVVVASDGATFRWSVARVVWSGYAAEPKVDLALLRTECVPFATFRFARELTLGAPVLCAGAGVTSTWFAGGTLRAAPAPDATGVRELHHDAPLTVGDSGGPAMLPDGSLAGVDVRTQPRRFGLGAPDSTALLPDERFVRGLIDAELARERR